MGVTVRVPERNLIITELRLPRPLSLDECMHLEHAEDLRPGIDEISTRLDHHRHPKPGILATVLEVVFHPDRLPARVFAHLYRNGREERVPVPLTGTSAQFSFLGDDVGMASLSWEWE